MGLRTPRQQQLQQLASMVPGQAQEQVKLGQEQQTASLQQAFSYGQKAPDSQPSVGQIQAMGAQAVKEQGQLGLAAQQQAGQQLAQIGQQQLQAQGQQNQFLNQNRSLDLQRQEQELTKRLYQLDRRTAKEVFSQQMKFERDQLGRTQFNERQLLDYKLMTAQSQEELADFELQVTDIYEKKRMLYDAAEKRLTQALQQEYAKGELERDHAFEKKLADMIYKAKQRKLRAIADAKNRAAIGTAVGSIVGGVIGTYLGSPQAGAAVGGAIGGAE